ncbi:MAG TPA: hypothetical protein PKH93_06870 [Chitinophagales bacterium]|nr:hypothetical protein [Chitinophagales bacterium]
MKTVDLFAGSLSFTKACKKLGHLTWTTDIKPLEGIDLVKDFMDLRIDDLPYIPDVLWASPDCSVWSLAAGSTHFIGMKPKTEKARSAMLLIDKLAVFINSLLIINPNMIFYIENPVGRLRNYTSLQPLFFGSAIKRVTLSQCQYGREFRKNTDLFTNDNLFIPQVCKDAKHCHHLSYNLYDKVPEQWANKTNYYERAKLPEQLFFEIFKTIHAL